ncbi:hypothetical protein [Christiangramia aquimixticola]|uniref:hypothetical protein n=1 Tax=Christiangramia aquimixticola TaxID=1697558 RepID=UPI003AA8BFDC
MRRFKILNIVWGFILSLLIILSILYAFISTDAPYYLSIARDISRGYAPYKDIFSSYTPVMMYLNSLLHLWVEQPSYHFSLVFQYIITTIAVVFFYKICRIEKQGKTMSVFLSFFLFISILSSDGTYINLEVYVIMFSLIAFYLLLKERFLWSGVFLALGFFSKQYGIFNFLPFLLLIVSYHGFRKHLVKFIIGGLAPLFIFLIYFVFFERVEFQDLALQLTGSGYDQEMIELETTWFRFLAGAKIFILLVVPLVLIRRNPFRDKIDSVLILGIFINLLPLYIQTVSHYFILTFPYIFILLARNIDFSNRRILVVSNVVLVIIAGLLFTRIFKYREVYNEQLDLAEKIQNVYPVGSKVFLYKHFRFLYILNDYQNPVLKEIGYRYGFKPDQDFGRKYNVLAK